MYTILATTDKNLNDDGSSSKNSGTGDDSKITAISVARLLMYAIEDLESIEAFEPVNLVSTALRQLREKFKIRENDLFPTDGQNERLAE